MQLYDVVVIGGGPCGIASAISAKREGAGKVCILERESGLGGMLNEHIHNGFGIKTLGVEVTGPEYIQRLIDDVKKYDIEYKVNTTVLQLTNEKKITFVNEKSGIRDIHAKTVILATGCREQPMGATNIPRNKCAGIYTCGTARKLVNIEGVLPGKEVVIYGSSNLALLTARRLKLEGADIKSVIEKNLNAVCDEEYVEECLNDFSIPLKLGYSIIGIKGKERIEGVTIAKVDENRKAIENTSEYIECDTLLLSVRLFPEMEILEKIDIEIDSIWNGPIVDEYMETNVKGIFACGNLVKLCSNTDNVVLEGIKVGKEAVKYCKI